MKGFEGKPGGTLEINIRAPENAENIYIAPANRLLIILLRRGFLQQHTTLSSLFEGNDFEILIAKEHLDKPVFLKLKSRSYLSDADLAASAHSMTDYLNLRAVAAGYPNGATMYAWRRKAGTLIDRALGRDAARVLMNHDAGSKTFERHYEEKTLDLVCATIVYGEDVEKAKQDMIANNTERLFRINIKMSKQQQEDFISRYVDENLQLGSEVNMRAERQRLRRLARLAIRKAAVDYHRQTFTRDEFAERAEALGDPTAFNRNLSERVRPLLEEIRKRAATGQPELDLDEEDDGGEDDAQDVGEQTGLFFGDEGDDYNDSDLSETDMSPPEQESSSVLVENSSGAVRHFVVDTDRGDDLDKISQLPYAVTVYQFFSMMLEKALLPGEPRQCDECLADPTVSAEEKQRLWRSASALQNHLKTQFHSLKKKFQRHLTIERESADTKKWQCPLASCEEAFNSMDGVMQHLHALLEAKDQEDPHHEEMVKAGWYSINWEQTAAAKKAVKLQPSTTGARKEISNLKKRPMLEYLSAPQPAQPWNSPYVLCGPRSEDVTLLQHAAIVNMDILATPKSFEGVPGVLTGDQQQASLGEITERSERGSGVLWGEGFKRFKSLSKY